MKALELWGGPECTLNRVGDGYKDQFSELGHYARDGDTGLFARLGVTALRYPVLWERVAPDHPDECDWRWPDRQLQRLRAADMRIIAGLIHHGGGPRYTDLLDPGFATGLAGFAAKVAERYDWVEDWTPVNEPLTTARFSALYGHWHPHHRSERSFWHALVNQVDGTGLAMRAIRCVNPKARLIQTDDLGRTYATVAMRDQAAFDNQRRWMGWDLLCGRVTPDHPFWKRLEAFGLGDRLRAIADDPCPPDVIGLNHYLTSDRFLDHRRRRYPAATHGGNRKVRFADVEALRVLEPPPPGLSGAVREAWARYGIPIAITEIHNGCTRDEQMRWIAAAWDDCLALRDEGVEVEAMTSWSLLGSAGWNTLLREPGVYEVGAYDVSSGTARPTAVVPLLQGLTTGQPRHPVLAGAGWWQRPIRLLHQPGSRPAPMHEHARQSRVAGTRPAPPLLICGATGTLGQALARACAHRDIAHVLTDRAALDLADEASIARALDTHTPWAVINAAGWVRVDEAEDREAACRQANTVGAIALARACAERHIPTVGFSSDLVFDGGRDSYVETDEPCPLNAYGHSKAAMERGVLDLSGAHLIVRTAAFFSPDEPHNFAAAVVRELGAGRPFHAAHDETVSPTYVPLLVDRVLDLVIDGETGIWHLASDDAVSWADFAKRVAQTCRLDPTLVIERAGRELTRAPRPRAAALRSVRGQGLGPLDGALRSFAERCACPDMMARDFVSN